MDATEKKKYNQMENVLNTINQKYITLPGNETKRNNKILTHVTATITSKMKEKDVLFKNMFERHFYGGSFYDGLKVSKPEEFDLDFVLKLPVIIEPELQCSDKSGFVHIVIKEYKKMIGRDEAPKFDKLHTLMDDDNYLCTTKTLQWMEKIITLVLNELKKENGSACFDVDLGNNESIKIFGTISKSVPAFTLKLTSNDDSQINLDIDLVPCFQFVDDKWPKQGYRSNPYHHLRNKFLVVPKTPYEIIDGCKTLERYWRLSFQEQERELITGRDFKAMKPTIKLLKKLRDIYNHKMASYYIKTIFLWEVNNQSTEFWSQPFSYVFMIMLRRYEEMIRSKRIPYYWNENYNLIEHLKGPTTLVIANFLKKMIEDIDKNVEKDPFTVAKYFVGPTEVDILKSQVSLGKKHLKREESLNNSASSSSSDIRIGVKEPPNSVCDILSLSNCSEDEVNKSQNLQLPSSSTCNGCGDEDKIRCLFESLHSKFDKILNAVEDLQAENRKLQTENSRILETCCDLKKQIVSLESKVDDLTAGNSFLKSTSNQQPEVDLLDFNTWFPFEEKENLDL